MNKLSINQQVMFDMMNRLGAFNDEDGTSVAEEIRYLILNSSIEQLEKNQKSLSIEASNYFREIENLKAQRKPGYTIKMKELNIKRKYVEERESILGVARRILKIKD